MLAEGYKGSKITRRSHYFESDQVDDHGDMIIHDPHQGPKRGFDGSHESPEQLVKQKTQRRVWVLVGKFGKMLPKKWRRGA